MYGREITRKHIGKHIEHNGKRLPIKDIEANTNRRPYEIVVTDSHRFAIGHNQTVDIR